MADIIQTFPSGGAGGGHTILDTDGQAVAQESKLQFNGLSVTDDSTNGVTEVEGESLNQDSLDDIAGAQTLVPAVIIGDSNNYSTTEKVIGKWIDGKPLYQRTYVFTGPNAELKTIDSNLTNENVVKIEGQCVRSSDGVSGPIPFFPDITNVAITDFTSFLKYVMTLFYNNDSHKIMVSTTGDRSEFTCYVTLKYTKTTD